MVLKFIERDSVLQSRDYEQDGEIRCMKIPVSKVTIPEGLVLQNGEEYEIGLDFQLSKKSPVKIQT